MDDLKIKLEELIERRKAEKPKCNCYRCTGYQEHFMPPVNKEIHAEQERQLMKLAMEAGLVGGNN